jgi:hypothetical protein
MNSYLRMSNTDTNKYCKNCKHESLFSCYHPINGLDVVTGGSRGNICVTMRRGACSGGVLYEPSKLTKVLMFFRLI